MTDTSMPNALIGTPPIDADTNRLRLLVNCHWIVGAIQLLLACLPLINAVTGVLMIYGLIEGPSDRIQREPQLADLFVFIFASVAFVGMSFGAATLISGFKIRSRKNRTFSIVVAVLNCLHFPFGTTLGVFTLIVLLRRSVEELYRSTART